MIISKGGSEKDPKAEIWNLESEIFGICEEEQFTDRGGDIQRRFSEGQELEVTFSIRYAREDAEWMLRPHPTKCVNDSIEIYDISGKSDWMLALVHLEAFKNDKLVYDQLKLGDTVFVALDFEEEEI